LKWLPDGPLRAGWNPQEKAHRVASQDDDTEHKDFWPALFDLRG
jgi:hypothetical protein